MRMLLILSRVSRRRVLVVSGLLGLLITYGSVWCIQLFGQWRFSVSAHSGMYFKQPRHDIWASHSHFEQHVKEWIWWRFQIAPVEIEAALKKQAAHLPPPPIAFNADILPEYYSIPDIGKPPNWSRIDAVLDDDVARRFATLPPSAGQCDFTEQVAGWPFRSVWWGEMAMYNANGTQARVKTFGTTLRINVSKWQPGESRVIAFTPVWPGLLANWATFVTTIGASLFGAKASVRAWLRRRGRCVNGAHTLLADQAVCPECGCGKS